MPLSSDTAHSLSDAPEWSPEARERFRVPLSSDTAHSLSARSDGHGAGHLAERAAVVRHGTFVERGRCSVQQSVRVAACVPLSSDTAHSLSAHLWQRSA